MKRKVSVTKCKSYEPSEIKESLINGLNNLRFKVPSGKKVLIKPNVLGPHSPEEAITTHPVIIEELCKILKKNRCEIMIGDSSGFNTDESLKKSGISMLSEYGRILNFDNEEVRIFDFKKRKIPIPKIIFDVDFIINIAKMKTHSFTGVTLSAKNLYGCVPGKIKGYLHKVNKSSDEISELLVELNRMIKPALNILDGVEAIEGNGPGVSGKKIKAGYLLMSENSFALDIIGSDLMGFKFNEIKTNVLSRLNKEEIEVIGGYEKLSFKKPAFFVNPVFSSIRNFFPQPKIYFDKEKCMKCRVCEESCPVKAISLMSDDGFPKCTYKNCIRCFCCIEMCPYDAVSLKDHWSLRSIKESVRFLNNLKGD